MKKKGFVSLGLSTILYSRASQEKKDRISEKRLRELVAYARKNSPFYAGLYRDLREDFELADLPVVNKKMMMEHFDDFVTDREIHLEDVKKFTADLSNIEKRYLGKYMVALTSGSTGAPAYILHDRIQENVTSVFECLRVFRLRFPVAMVSTYNSFALSTGNIRQNLHKMPSASKYVKIIDSVQTPNEIIRQLNEFRPKIICSYPGNLVLLFNQPNVTEKITFKPDLILLGGEYLADSTRKTIEEGFGCRVSNTYMSTEASAFTIECSYHHLHLNNEWTLFEAVDKDNRPVKEGELSDKILITNLADYTQPRIRYEMNDRVRYHAGGTCPCGCKDPWIEVEGRISDILYFQKDGERIGVAPMALLNAIEYTPGVSCFQGVLHPDSCFELRLNVCPGYTKQKVFEAVDVAVRKRLKDAYGIDDVKLFLSGENPKLDPVTHKFKQFISEKAD